MPRPPADWKAIHDAADVFEGRLARAVAKAAGKMRAAASVAGIAGRLEAAQRAKRAGRRVPAAAISAIVDRILSEDSARDALAPAAAIAADAVLRGGRIGAEAVNRATRGRKSA
jgi:hypothetical protein